MKLQYKITLLVFAILVTVGATSAAIMLDLQRRSATSQFEESALTLAGALMDSLKHDMLEGNENHTQETVVQIAAGSPINEVVILSNVQEVYASGESSEIGELRDDEEIAQALASGETVTRTKRRYGRDEVSVILPIMNGAQCHACHGSEAKILGAIEVGLDRGPLDEQLRDQTLLMALIGGLTLLGVGGALALTLRPTVVNPLSKLAASARRIAQGDFSARVEVEKKDEVGTVARAFNEMAERVEQHAHALEDSKIALEQRVQERTREVQQMAAVRGQLLERLVSAQEEERRRIARELHDEASQALTMIMMNLAQAIDTLPGDATEAKKKLSQSRSLAAQTLAELRKLIYDLRPEVLDQLGLVPALRSYVKSHLEAENIQTRVRFIGLEGRLPSQVEITLFRVIQEAVTNIVRHSGASVVNIEVVARKSVVTAAIEDNGRGFDVEATLESPESWGLRGIRERVAVLGGELSIESGAGQGTRLQFRIPLEKV